MCDSTASLLHSGDTLGLSSLHSGDTLGLSPLHSGHTLGLSPLHSGNTSGSRGGGVGILFNKNLRIKPQPSCDFESFEFIDVLLTYPGKNVRIVNIYRPPPTATNGLTVALFLNELSATLSSTPSNLSQIGSCLR